MPDSPTSRIADLSILHPSVRTRVLDVLAQLERESIPLRVFESFRTPARQKYLYSQGRTRPGKIVSNADSWQSYHQYGLAVDLVFHEGEWHWGKNPEHKRMYTRMHEIARSCGLEPLSWETPHIQLMGQEISQLMKGRFPAGGDAAWAENLIRHAQAWTGNPPAPPVGDIRGLELDAERPPLAADSLQLPVGNAGESDLPLIAVPRLRSRSFAGSPALESVAAGHRVLRTSGIRVEGVEQLQDGMNLLASVHPRYSIDTGSFRGYFGQRTERAIKSFQTDNSLVVDGLVGEETIIAIDDALSSLQQEASLAGIAWMDQPSALAAYVPPVANSELLKGVRFDTADAGPGQELFAAYAAADRDPALAKSDPSRCKALLKFPDGTVFFEAKMAICADGSPRADEIDPGPGYSKTAFTYPGMANTWFNAEHVPYFVLPGKNPSGSLNFTSALGIAKLDLGVVIHQGRVTPAFYGEVGPWFRIGEASIKVHEELPVRSPWTTPGKTRVRNASVDGEVLYFVFPGTAVARPTSMSKEDWISACCAAALAKWQIFLQAQPASPTGAGSPQTGLPPHQHV